MAIPYFGDKGAFRPQTSDLLPQDLYLAARVVNAYAHAGRETTMFFKSARTPSCARERLSNVTDELHDRIDSQQWRTPRRRFATPPS